MRGDRPPYEYRCERHGYLGSVLDRVYPISVTGGLIGVLFGVGAALIVNVVAHFPIYIQPWSVLLSFVVCTVTGVFFRMVPGQEGGAARPDRESTP